LLTSVSETFRPDRLSAAIRASLGQAGRGPLVCRRAGQVRYGTDPTLPAGSSSSARSRKSTRRACISGGVSRSHPYSRSRRTALIVPTPSKCSARAAGTVSIECPHVPSGCCNAANVNAGRCVNGRDPTCSGIGVASFATSIIDRNFIGAEACSISQQSGKLTVGDGKAVARVSGVASEPGDVCGEGGRVTERSCRARKRVPSSSLLKASR